ncbi:MAG: ABC transporter ATP-binding protein [Clostridiales Family XIII bacterium]|jgi:peptide/nickel transport system ATP-binding protein|nr:ABC transporter ATP-binding protein [Clostridiales Family XIII bacterium]
MEPILSVEELAVSFSMYDRGLRKADLAVIRSLSLDVRPGEVLGVIGSSGSGKSLLAHAIMGILPPNATVRGEVLYRGEPLTEARLRGLRGREIAFIPQSVDYLDPLMRVGRQVVGTFGTRAAQEAIFERYRLGAGVARMYPFQLSGGMARRVLFATAAVGGDVKLVVADEPTPGLGPDLAAKMMKHFREFADAGAGVLLITHDVDLALGYADRIAVFYAGATVEIATAAEFAAGGAALRHPYSRAFSDALPQNRFLPIPGSQPYAGSLPEGCPFAARCPERTEACLAGDVPMRDLRGGKVRCVHAA